MQNKGATSSVFVIKINLINSDNRMKKTILTAALAAILCASMTSCMGKFALTRNLYAWNDQVSNKFVNEVLFVAFWILPVYEVCGLADLLVLNTIEFWSGDNPISASTKKIDTDNGRYLVVCDGKGYDITLEETGESYRLDFAQDTRTWSLNIEGKECPLMTFVDSNHVAAPTPDGNWQTVELSEEGVLAYREMATNSLRAAR